MYVRTYVTLAPTLPTHNNMNVFILLAQVLTSDETHTIQQSNHAQSSSNLFKNHPRIKVVSYESIIINFKKTISDILEFMGLDYDHKVEFFYQDNNIHFKKGSSDIAPEEVEHLRLRNWQMKQPLFDGRGSWRDLSFMQKKFISLHDEFQNFLKALNYN